MHFARIRIHNSDIQICSKKLSSYRGIFYDEIRVERLAYLEQKEICIPFYRKCLETLMLNILCYYCISSLHHDW